MEVQNGQFSDFPDCLAKSLEEEVVGCWLVSNASCRWTSANCCASCFVLVFQSVHSIDIDQYHNKNIDTLVEYLLLYVLLHFFQRRDTTYPSVCISK